MSHRWTNGHDHMLWNINFKLAICHLPNAIPDSASYYNYYNNNLHACFCWLTGRQLNDRALDIENWGIWIRLLMHQYAYVHIPINNRNMQIYIWGWNNWNFLFSCNLNISLVYGLNCVLYATELFQTYSSSKAQLFWQLVQVEILFLMGFLGQ